MHLLIEMTYSNIMSALLLFMILTELGKFELSGHIIWTFNYKFKANV